MHLVGTILRMSMVTCQGITKKGQRCRNAPIAGTLYCRYHKPIEADTRREVYERLANATPG